MALFRAISKLQIDPSVTTLSANSLRPASSSIMMASTPQTSEWSSVDTKTSAQPTNLCQLPTELLTEILSYPPISDLKALRLTNSTFLNITAQWLFRSVYLLFNTKSFEHLVQISSHSYIRTCVKELIYEADRLDHICAKAQWRAVVQDNPYIEQKHKKSAARKQGQFYKPEFWGKPYSSPELDNGFKYYQELQRDQEDVKRFHHDRVSLSEALFKLPSLEAILFSTRQYVFPFSPYYQRIHSPGQLHPAGEQSIAPDDYPGLHAFVSLIRALTDHGKSPPKLHNLKAGLVHWSALKRLVHLTHCGPQLQIRQTLANMRDFRLFLTVHANRWIDVQDQITACREYLHRDANDSTQAPLFRFLSSLPNLRRLTIGFDTLSALQGKSLQAVCDLTDIVGPSITDKPVWPHLEHFSLAGVLITRRGLTSFLHRQSGTLTSLHLCHPVAPERENWADIVQDWPITGVQWKSVKLGRYVGRRGERVNTRQKSLEKEKEVEMRRELLNFCQGKQPNNPVRECLEFH